MAEITKTLVPSLTTPLPGDPQRTPPLTAGEDLGAADCCYVKSDGLVYRTDGTSATGVVGTNAEVDGVTMKVYKAGMAVTIYHDVDMVYATGLTPGTFVYPSGTVKGGIATAAGSIQAKPCGRVLPADSPDTRQRIRFFRTYGG